jgi:Flp pilus assembly pilin Flp
MKIVLYDKYVNDQRTLKEVRMNLDLFGKLVKSGSPSLGEKGQTLVEYGLLVILIAIVVILILKGTGLQVNNLFSAVNSSVANP